MKTWDNVNPGAGLVIVLQLCGFIIATAAGAIMTPDPPDRGGSVQIKGSLVHLVVNHWVSGHEIHENGPRSTVNKPIGLSQGPRGKGGQV